MFAVTGEQGAHDRADPCHAQERAAAAQYAATRRPAHPGPGSSDAPSPTATAAATTAARMLHAPECLLIKAHARSVPGLRRAVHCRPIPAKRTAQILVRGGDALP